MTRFPILLLGVALILVTGCSSFRGELVETGFGDAIELAASETPAAKLASARQEESPDSVRLGHANAIASFDFQARELYSGSIVDGVELFGQGQVLVTFVQPGCDITLNHGATIAETAKSHPESIFVIVHSGARDEVYQSFAEQAMLFQENIVHLSDTYGSLAQRYNVSAYPTTLLIDSDLRITAVTGVMDQGSQRKAIQAVAASHDTTQT